MSSSQESKPRMSLWQIFKSEFRLENFSLNFELNSEFQKIEPEKMLECFHSIFVSLNFSLIVIDFILIFFQLGTQLETLVLSFTLSSVDLLYLEYTK